VRPCLALVRVSRGSRAASKTRGTALDPWLVSPNTPSPRAHVEHEAGAPPPWGLTQAAPTPPESRGDGGAVRPERRARREIRVCRLTLKIAASSTPAERHADDSPSACPTARAATPNPRRGGAKTMKYPTRGVLHDVAQSGDHFRREGGEALSCPSSSILPPRPSPVVLSQARHWAAAGPVLGPPPVHLKARSRSTNEHRVWAGSGHRSIAPPNSSRSTHRLCRVPADEPSLVPL